jgi:hypothetical protein
MPYRTRESTLSELHGQIDVIWASLTWWGKFYCCVSRVSTAASSKPIVSGCSLLCDGTYSLSHRSMQRCFYSFWHCAKIVLQHLGSLDSATILDRIQWVCSSVVHKVCLSESTTYSLILPLLPFLSALHIDILCKISVSEWVAVLHLKGSLPNPVSFTESMFQSWVV